MKALSAERVRACYRAACELDVQAFKPGNVSVQSPGHGMTASDFLRSARHSASPIAREGVTLGRRILDSVSATRAVVDCNTNLGIVLLIAPLVQAHYSYPGIPLAVAVSKVLATTDIADTEAVYRAVRLAAPGGLGEAERHDVSGLAGAALTDVMREAEAHDLIARQYANGYIELLHDACPYLAHALKRQTTVEYALTDLFLYLLANYPDSHIGRKYGDRVAADVMVMAAETRRVFDDAANDDRRLAALYVFDETLKQRDINPGTTADFCVAACFSHRLQSQATANPGTDPDNPRNTRPSQAGLPRLSIRQAYEGEMKWQ